ncbi:hypothetical protein [Fibrisoma limi]|nr:hypothetical protein [Fibrisoma limi]
MENQLSFLGAILLFVISFLSPVYVSGQVDSLIDDEYDRYKNRGDAHFRQGSYLEARRHYQSCLEVPGFEANPWIKSRIEYCSKYQVIRQQAENAQVAEAIGFYRELLGYNPEDANAKDKLIAIYDKKADDAFDLKRYREAIVNYGQMLKYTADEKKINEVNERIKKANVFRLNYQYSKLQIAAGVVAIGAGTYALLLRNDYQKKRNALDIISRTVDPENIGLIESSDGYRQYKEAYSDVQSAQNKNGWFKAGVGVAVAATIAELYLILNKSKLSTSAITWRPSSDSVGLTIGYRF